MSHTEKLVADVVDGAVVTDVVVVVAVVECAGLLFIMVGLSRGLKASFVALGTPVQASSGLGVDKLL